jgi:zinc protease
MASDKQRFATPLGRGARGDPHDFVLQNGLRVLFVQRDRSPIAELRLVVDGGGFAADPEGRSGLGALATAMFSEGVLRIDGVQLGSALEVLGAQLNGHVTPDTAVIGLSALNLNFGDTLRIWSDVLTHPEFSAEDFELLRASQLALVASERLNPFDLALRVLPPFVYGFGHLYSCPFSGSGTQKGVAAITLDDLHRYYAAHLAPCSTILVVAGSYQASDLRTKLEATFGKWQARALAAPRTPVTDTFEKDVPSVALVNRPGSPQAVLAAGLRTVARNSAAAEAVLVADAILAGIFTSRLNLNLREQKGWTYGVRSSLFDARAQGFWLIRTAVRRDCAAQAMLEVSRELENLAGLRPSTADEFSHAVNYLVARIPSTHETCAQIADALAHLVIHQLPLSYLRDQANFFNHLTPRDVTETCRQILAAGGPKWMVVGEAEGLHDQLRNAGFPGIEIIEPS